MTCSNSPSRRCQPPAVGVLLAAGLGSRFEGGNKLLAELDGVPVVRRAAETLHAAVDGPILVVVGHEAERVRTALDGLDVRFVDNPDYERGQATSVAAAAAEVAGLDVLDGGSEQPAYVVFALGDMPAVRRETVERLLAVARDRKAGIVVPTHEGRRGNPVVFHRQHLSSLAALDGDRGGRTLFEREEVTRLAVDDPGIHRDVDTADDLDSVDDS